MALRSATDDDRDVILRWRNHPTVRQASLTTHEIGVDEHARWWAAAQADPARHVLVYAHDAVDCGVVIIGVESDGSGTWSYYLDLDGLGARDALMPAWIGLERAAVDYAFEVLGVDRLGGEVLAWNTAVLALHQRLGFRAVRRYDREVDGHPQHVIWLELGARSRPGSSRGQRTGAGHA